MAKTLYKLIGRHIIDDLMMAGISVLVFAFGFNYFNLKNSWAEAFSTLSSATNVHFIEGNLILNSISNTFPFSLFTSDFSNFFIAALVGLALTILGFVLKILTTKTKEQFIEELGEEFYIPAILGLLGIFILHIVTAFTLRHQTTTALDIAAKFNAGVFVWKNFGSIFTAGLIALVFGSVILFVAKSRRLDKIVIVGRTMVNSSYVLIGYYLFIRLLAFNVVLESPVGSFLKIFIVSGDISNTMIIFTIFMFWLGRELERYGKYLRVKKKYEVKQRDEMHFLQSYSTDAPRPAIPSPSMYYNRK